MELHKQRDKENMNMKISLLRIPLWLLAFLVFGWSCSFQNNEESGMDLSTPDVIEVIDFYGTHRCETCINIENRTLETLNTYYAEELKNGSIVFKTINVDEEDNYEIAKAFEATGTALFINVIKDSESEKINLTDFAFMNIHDEGDEFELGLIKELRTALIKI